MLVSAVLGLHEVAHRRLRRGEPVGLDVRRAHRPRHVERQDHGRLRDRHVGIRRAAGPRPARARPRAASTSANGTCRRQAARRGAAARISATLENRTACRRRRRSCHDVRRDQQRHGEQRQQGERPGEAHADHPPEPDQGQADARRAAAAPAAAASSGGHLDVLGLAPSTSRSIAS